MKREIKKGVAVLLAIVTITAILANPLYAAAASWEGALYKLDSVLLEKLETMSGSDCVDVSIWLQDIDYEEVDQETQQVLQAGVSQGKVSENVLQLAMHQQNNTSNDLPVFENTSYLATEDATASQDVQVYIETRRSVAAQAYEEQNASLYHMLFPSEEYGLLHIQGQQQPSLLYISTYAPNILLTLTKDEIYKIIRYACVQSIDYFDNDLSSVDAAQEQEIELAAASADQSYFNTTGITSMKNKGYTGANIKIGMFESGVPITTQGTSHRQVFEHMLDENNASNTRLHIRPQDVAKGSDHASLVACLLVGKTSSYTGAVPDAQLYCAASSANSVSETYEGIEWLIAQGVNVINFSWIYVNTGNNSYDVYAKWFDHLVYNHSVSIVNAAGNGTVENGTKVNQNRVGRNAMAYNIITVGNYDSYQQTVGTSTAYNTVATLAYKPDLVAPGYRLVTPLNANTGGTTGTSLSAPLVTGAVAQLCQVFSYFKTKPVALKAFLLAGAVKTQQMKEFDTDSDSSNNVDSLSGSWRMGLCRKNGAGMLNALNAYTVLYDSNYFYFPNFGASNNGYSETIQVTSTAKRLQICLNWLKKNTVSGSDHSTGTINDASRDTYLLEILDPDGETIYMSWYRYDTKEYIAFTPSRTGTYTVKIQKSGTQGQDVTVAWFQ